MKILVINQPLNNRGDESAHRGFMKALTSISGVEVTVLFVYGKQDSINQYNINVPNAHYVRMTHRWRSDQLFKYGVNHHCKFLWRLHPKCREYLRIYKEHDIVVCSPGGICLGGFQNWDHLVMLEIARFLKKPLAYYGRSFGPFPEVTEDNRRFKKAALKMLHYMGFMSFRDEKSQELANSLSLKYEPTIDSAFLASPEVDMPLEVKKVIGNDKYIVYVPNSLTWHYAYRDKLTEADIISFFLKILDVLVAKYPNHKILMLPQIFNSGYESGDKIFFDKLKSSYNNDNLIALDEIYNSDFQQSIIAKADLMVGARYHSIVFALNNATPFVAFNYEHKIEGLLRLLGNTQHMVDITECLLTEEGTTNALTEFEEKLELADSDEEAKNKAKAMAMSCFKKFEVYLNSVK